jgi:hypothetical protein
MIPQLGYQNTESISGMVPSNAVSRNTVISSLNMLGSGGSMAGSVPPSIPALGGGLRQQPICSFSMATSVNPCAGSSMNPNPSDEELFNALHNYLSTQDDDYHQKVSICFLPGLNHSLVRLGQPARRLWVDFRRRILFLGKTF